MSVFARQRQSDRTNHHLRIDEEYARVERLFQSSVRENPQWGGLSIRFNHQTESADVQQMLASAPDGFTLGSVVGRLSAMGFISKSTGLQFNCKPEDLLLVNMDLIERALDDPKTQGRWLEIVPDDDDFMMSLDEINWPQSDLSALLANAPTPFLQGVVLGKMMALLEYMP